eukprot:5035973-Pyramimonas_sp.AAC.1
MAECWVWETHVGAATGASGGAPHEAAPRCDGWSIDGAGDEKDCCGNDATDDDGDADADDEADDEDGDGGDDGDGDDDEDDDGDDNWD